MEIKIRTIGNFQKKNSNSKFVIFETKWKMKQKNPWPNSKFFTKIKNLETKWNSKNSKCLKTPLE